MAFILLKSFGYLIDILIKSNQLLETRLLRSTSIKIIVVIYFRLEKTTFIIKPLAYLILSNIKVRCLACQI